jgi:hypothetical protein
MGYIWQIQRNSIWGSHDRDRPDDRGSKDLWNVGKLLPDYTELQPIGQAIFKYNVVEICSSGNYAQKWISKL